MVVKGVDVVGGLTIGAIGVCYLVFLGLSIVELGYLVVWGFALGAFACLMVRGLTI